MTLLLFTLACSHDKTGVELDSGGDPYSDRAHTIVKVFDDSRMFVAIDSAEGTFCATASDGSVLCKSATGSSGTEPAGVQNEVPEVRLEDVSVSGDFGGHACGREIGGGGVRCWGCDERFEASCGTFDSMWTMVRPFSFSTCYQGVDGMIACIDVGESLGAWDPAKWSGRTEPVAMDGGSGLCASWADGTDCLGDEGEYLAHYVPEDSAFRQVSVGKEIACGLDSDNFPTCWGYERDFAGLPAEPMSVIMADFNTCFIRAADGSVDCVPAYLRPPEGVFVDVASYDGHPIAVRDDGALVEWMLDPAYDTGIPLDE